MEGHSFSVTLARCDDYEFAVRFDNPEWPALATDEPAPLGGGRGPNPNRVLAAAVGSCLASSLLFCLSKARVSVRTFDVRVEGTVGRNDQGRLRITGLRATLAPGIPAAERERMTRCLDLFEEFCTVTASVRQGIPVHVEVTPTDVE